MKQIASFRLAFLHRIVHICSSSQCLWRLGWNQTGRCFGGGTVATSVSVDTSGNVYVVGWTTGELNGNKRIGKENAVLLKFNSKGKKQFTQQFGLADVPYSLDLQRTRAESVTADVNGYVYIVGWTMATVVVDGKKLITKVFFLVKYDSRGVEQYRKIGGSYAWGESVAIDASGNVYVGGTTGSALDGNTQAGKLDFFVTKFDRNGMKQYTRQLGAAGAETRGYSVATDPNGNVYVAGTTNGGLDDNTLTGKLDYFVTKYDSKGVKQYTKQVGGPLVETWGFSVATDAHSMSM